MRNKRYFREATDNPILIVTMDYEALENQEIKIKPKPNLNIDISTFENPSEVITFIWDYFFVNNTFTLLNDDEGYTLEDAFDDINDDFFNYVTIKGSKNMKAMFNDKAKIDESELETLIDLYKSALEEDLDWNKLLIATESIHGDTYGIEETFDVLANNYKGSTDNLKEYFEEMGIYIIKDPQGFLIFDTN
jgi:hypothetical protein